MKELGKIEIDDHDGAPMRRTLVFTQLAYANGRLAIKVTQESDGYPYATLSTNVPDAVVAPDEFVVNSMVRSGPASLLDNHMVEPTGRTVDYGFVKNAPVYRLRATN